eukprot:TRINITY_DN959_c0_g1_i1.p1 TRINITY_DN959_c0_g1~~TRINITY_DN959_c0_g1_i1.p1  ORF type:complete len:171 (-),score=41.72 TRINITY_DN959_c0_g1_i1:105-617(-)
MDQPLFGEQRKGAQVFQWIVAALVLIFFLFSTIAGVIFGIKDTKHFGLIVTLVFCFADLCVLTWWWRDKEDRLHPKFKYLVGMMVVTVIICGAALNAYIWYKPPPGPSCSGLYDLNNAICYPDPQKQFSACTGNLDLTSCLLFNTPSEGTATCVYYNTTTCVPPGYDFGY